MEVTETGSSLRANNLRIIAEVLQSTTRFVANKAAIADDWKRAKIDNLALMLKSCLAAEGKVGLMMNVRRVDLPSVLEQLPASAKADGLVAVGPRLGGRQHDRRRIVRARRRAAS